VIEGIEIAVDREASGVTAREPLTVLSSTFVRGGLTAARAIVNLHVPKNLREDRAEGLLPRFALRRAIPGPWVGLLTAAWTERAEVAHARERGLTAMVTVGLSNRVAAGTPPVAAWAPSTINVVVAATGRGTPHRFGGPISDLGRVVARAARGALESGIRRWMDEHS
jgi:adenosylcobinamide amidohydrolase